MATMQTDETYSYFEMTFEDKPYYWDSELDDAMSERLGNWMHRSLHPQFSVVVAVLAVVLWHFQAPILHWWDSRRELTLWESLVDLYWTVLDYTRAYAQMAFEWMMRSRPNLSLFDSKASMPELELVNDSDSSRMFQEEGGQTNTVTPTPEATPARFQQTELEPAFLNEMDYPPNWMVYHPQLGVVPKTVADRYKRTPDVLEDVHYASCSTASPNKQQLAANVLRRLSLTDESRDDL